jgi:hypothetical protein
VLFVAFDHDNVITFIQCHACFEQHFDSAAERRSCLYRWQWFRVSDMLFGSEPSAIPY